MNKVGESILSRVKAGEILNNILIIDAHAHMGRWYEIHIPQNGTPEAMIQEMDYLGIDIACISALVGIGPDYALGNDLVTEAVKKYPKRFVGSCVVNPHYPEDLERELNQCLEESKMRLIKIHCCFHRYPVNGPNYDPVWQYAGKYDCPVLAHIPRHNITQEDIENYSQLATRYPTVNFIFAHAGGGVNGVIILNKLIAAAQKNNNLYLDLACSYPYFGIIEKLVSEVGAEKIVFGSDMPILDASVTLGRLLYAKISDEQKKRILGQNMADLLHMTPLQR